MRLNTCKFLIFQDMIFDINREIFHRLLFMFFISLFFLGFTHLYQHRDLYFIVIYGGIYIQFMLFTPYFILVLRQKSFVNSLVTFLIILIYLKALGVVYFGLYVSIVVSLAVYYIQCFLFVLKNVLSFENHNPSLQIIPIRIFFSQNSFIKYFLISLSAGLLCFFILSSMGF
jgi:hypothetical protein